jgi:hypothetical protein
VTCVKVKGELLHTVAEFVECFIVVVFLPLPVESGEADANDATDGIVHPPNDSFAIKWRTSAVGTRLGPR